MWNTARLVNTLMDSAINHYDIVVIGGGHAGVEAALVASRLGKSTLLLTMRLDSIAQMSCNPAIGGLAKGHLVRELDILGGEMAKAADSCGIQFMMLNRSKGPAVWSPRAQVDKRLYSAYFIALLQNTPGLTIVEDMATEIVHEAGVVAAVKTSAGKRYPAGAVIVTAGTFLNGRIYTGLHATPAGRLGEAPATGLTEQLVTLGFEQGRLKTGTPPRVYKDSVDFSCCKEQPGDSEPVPFHYYDNLIHLPQVSCYLTYTNERTHAILAGGMDRSPLFTGMIESVGPRYCPSIEDKVVRFADRNSHHIFLEPEGLESPEVYVNGFSTSLPEDVQLAALQTIPGLENVRVSKWGYAIEYDYFPPQQLKHTLETDLIENLYFAGQINGTSGYEEAAVQGFMASVNAVRKLDGQSPFTLKRNEAYIGVLIDDLVTLGTVEPYRMFTSRSEFRLLLRHDNADERLMNYGSNLGLTSESRWQIFTRRQKSIQLVRDFFETKRADLMQLTALGITAPQDNLPLFSQLLKRPEMSIGRLEALVSNEEDWIQLDYDHTILHEVEIRIKYDGYIKRQQRQAEQFLQNENRLLPAEFDYNNVKSISNESREKLKKIQPTSLGQAARISGVTPADLTVLLIHLKNLSKADRVPHGTSCRRKRNDERSKA